MSAAVIEEILDEFSEPVKHKKPPLPQVEVEGGIYSACKITRPSQLRQVSSSQSLLEYGISESSLRS